MRGLALAHKTIRHAAVERRRDAGGARSPRTASRCRARLARSLNGQLSGTMGRFPASVAGVRQAGRRRLGRRRSSRAEGPRSRPCARLPTDGPDAFYKGWIADRIAEDMAANGGLITKADLAQVRSEGAHAGSRHVTGVRDRLDAAAQLRRRRADRDAEHPRAVPPEVERPQLCGVAAPADRSDAPRATSIARATLAIPTSSKCRSTR